MPDRPTRTDYLQSLERGLAVLQVFSKDHARLTLSDVARLAGITRATARRILLTLEHLGHVRAEGRLFSLTPRVLSLGFGYLSSLNLWEVAQPYMEQLVEQTHESCSAATLDLPDIVYVARVPTRRIMTIALGIGSRLPAHSTSMGRVLLADLPDAELDAFLATGPFAAATERTTTDPEELRTAVRQVREQGWSMVDQELETGLRSISAPIRGADGRTIAALNLAAAAPRIGLDELRGQFLPPLLTTADQISLAFRHSGRR
ncbi:IclR family transcriptional regulator C-terminal domain-containing protein [Blastococcus sp. CT_GayMR16]|uniref:IclR family transcriptional regulator domain-containing protein n=1 Tax=Blastococcus sp. CT_GayMR16 TaxID=2559607 RepID=UPI0010733C7B|nr:IclR family transcriptional regulator C-terminal domain-containing protein [Blastococcus sp. CT_GayMR16]TFV89861.1 IclR family transcriptional regulator [Blastococcus sp. CT_GayMR16]